MRVLLLFRRNADDPQSVKRNARLVADEQLDVFRQFGDVPAFHLGDRRGEVDHPDAFVQIDPCSDRLSVDIPRVVERAAVVVRFVYRSELPLYIVNPGDIVNRNDLRVNFPAACVTLGFHPAWSDEHALSDRIAAVHRYFAAGNRFLSVVKRPIRSSAKFILIAPDFIRSVNIGNIANSCVIVIQHRIRFLNHFKLARFSLLRAIGNPLLIKPIPILFPQLDKIGFGLYNVFRKVPRIGWTGELNPCLSRPRGTFLFVDIEEIAKFFLPHKPIRVGNARPIGLFAGFRISAGQDVDVYARAIFPLIQRQCGNDVVLVPLFVDHGGKFEQSHKSVGVGRFLCGTEDSDGIRQRLRKLLENVLRHISVLFSNLLHFARGHIQRQRGN